jgi:VWFA-related protein
VQVEGGEQSAPLPDHRLGANEVRRSIIFLVANPLIEIKNNFFSESQPFALPPSRLLQSAVVTDARAAARVLTRFVDQQMGPYDLAAIRESEGSPGSFSVLTADRSVLRRAVKRVQADPLKKGPKVTIIFTGSTPILQEWVQQNLRVIRMMDSAVDQLGRLPGRRALVLLSRGMLHGWNVLGTERVRAAMQELIAKANRAGVTVYTLNPRGPDPANLWGGGLQDNGGLMNLASETGGRAIFNANDLTQGFAGVLEENRGYYLLGYNPGQEAFARPHKIRVRVRRQGVHVQARSTAYASSTDLRGPVSRPQLVEVLDSPLAFSDIKLSLTPLFLSPDGRAARIISLVNIDLTTAERETRTDGSRAINLDVIGRVTSPDGRIVYQKGRSYALNIPSADAERTLTRGIDYWFDLDANAPGHYRIDIAVRDAGSGRAGNATQFIEVVDLSRGGLSASSLFLSAAVDDAVTASTSFPGEESLPTYVRRVFPAGGALRYQCYVYNARGDESSRASHIQVQMTIKRDGVAQAVTPARTISQTDAPIFVGGDIMLGGLPPGRYTLEAAITDMDSRTTRAVVSSDFQISN